MKKFLKSLFVGVILLLLIGSIYTKLFIPNKRLEETGYRIDQWCALEQLQRHNEVNTLEFSMILLGKVVTLENYGDSAEIKTYTIFGIPYKNFDKLWATCDSGDV